MPKIFLILFLSLSITGCSELPKFPNISKWFVNAVDEKITRFYLKDPEYMIYEEKETLDSLNTLHGKFCMSAEDEAKVATWVKDVKDLYKDCKCRTE